MFLIYTHQVTNRIRYTFDLIFRHVLGVEYNVTTDAEHFKASAGAKISYTHKPLANELFFQSSDLLFESGIKSILELPADPFALSFFLATRYEEYLPFEADQYGRFSASRSLLFKNKMLHRPVINAWARDLQQMLSGRYPDLHFPQRKYSYTPTVDIDNAYAYLGKGSMRTLGGYARALLKFDMDDVRRKSRTLSGKEKDPYDTYSLQFGLQEKYNLKPIYFFLLGDWAPNDKNLPHTNPAMKKLAGEISGRAETGIHPSFASNQEGERVAMEKKRLSEMTGKSITKSRQHFLILKFPQTYRNLIASGITDDYTMGYADQIGFRAGICTPYPWYDLGKEEEAKLLIHPFAVMDGTLNNYMRLSPEKAVQQVRRIVDEIKSVNGEFISIWHNETLSDWREWKGWKNVYEEVIKTAQ